MGQHDLELRIFARGWHECRRQRVGYATPRMADQRQSILQCRLEEKLVLRQRNVDRLKLRLDLEGHEPIHLTAPPDLLAKLGFPDEGIQARGADETLGVGSHRRPDLIMRLTETPNHRKGN